MVIVYMTYILTTSIYNSYLLDRHIENFREKNEEIAERYRNNLSDLQYFRSDTYAEKVAKEQFNMVNPGEEVIVLVDQQVNVRAEELVTQEESLKEYRRMSNPQKWWYYFFNLS